MIKEVGTATHIHSSVSKLLLRGTDKLSYMHSEYSLADGKADVFISNMYSYFYK